MARARDLPELRWVHCAPTSAWRDMAPSPAAGLSTPFPARYRLLCGPTTANLGRLLPSSYISPDTYRGVYNCTQVHVPSPSPRLVGPYGAQSGLYITQAPIRTPARAPKPLV